MNTSERTSSFARSARRIFFVVLAVLGTGGGAMWWSMGWMAKGPTPSSGGLFFPVEVLIDGPLFLQGDPKWGDDKLGPTADSMRAVGCAVASAAMVLAGYGIDTDPGRLNRFLTNLEGGYTPQGWIYWEKAAEIDPARMAGLLPHYEDKPSHYLMDSNLLKGNPVIVRLRYPNGITHFLVVCGKRGFDYLVRDPGSGGTQGVYPLKVFGSPIEALRFYQKPEAPR